MKRRKDILMDYEVDILQAAFGQDEGIYPYGFANQYCANGKDKITNGTIYRRFQVLESMGMLEKGESVEGRAAPKIPYELTVLGIIALSEVVLNLNNVYIE